MFSVMVRLKCDRNAPDPIQQLTMNNGQWTHDAKHRSRLTTRGGTPLPLFEGRKLRFRCATALHLFLKKED